MQSTAKLISEELSIPIENIFDALWNGKNEHRKFRIKKKTGGHREIRQPTPELRMIQDWLSLRLFSNFPQSAIASAFRTGASILNNAQKHSSNLYSIRVDLKDFFPSITLEDLKGKIYSNRPTLPRWATHKDTFSVLDAACFDERGTLPIGYSTSPAISNIVMLDFDASLHNLVKNDIGRFGTAELTRYADDFVFSTNVRGACGRFLEALKDAIYRCPSPRLQINDKKTKFMSRPGGSTLVTGLRVNNVGQIRVHPNYRDHVRLLLKLYAAGRLNPDENASLVGHLAFVENVDPQLFTKLSRRYYEFIRIVRNT
ncbi:retron St85 family RNA-directed DNA polymerase [Hydrogenophaga sp. SNF1]|uniref:retron St85 family RNA-directed DNA polymerase n=1 Tax=Hydrogenophaga sp. SNF1 TaxID=3098762 RepID=UPI002ACBEC23|nr:retron St85 family RNA-directed DNA polymerase [Hydrogenophaga sp. SNF1]WQB82133.1 retron St85 family RNA-directed DNA polymerase [Hydrogenophaga sp. SNF1]